MGMQGILWINWVIKFYMGWEVEVREKRMGEEDEEIERERESGHKSSLE